MTFVLKYFDIIGLCNFKVKILEENVGVRPLCLASMALSVAGRKLCRAFWDWEVKGRAVVSGATHTH